MKMKNIDYKSKPKESIKGGVMEIIEEPRFMIQTTMTREDYHRFLYLATFLRNKVIIPLLILMSIMGSLIIGFDEDGFSWIRFIFSFIILTPIAFGAIIFQVERKNAKRVKTDQTWSFDSINHLTFYEDKLVMNNEAFKSTGEVQYTKFYSVLESKDFFIFYLKVNQASLIRKVDITSTAEFREFIMGKFQGKYKKM